MFSAHTRIVALAFACGFSVGAFAQEKPPKGDDLDVTMRIIVDPNARTPEEVVRRIPLPSQRAPADRPAGPGGDKPDAATKGMERAEAARELGREAAERAQERAREARERREEARNSNADRRNTERGRPDEPGPPGPAERNRPDPPSPPTPRP